MKKEIEQPFLSKSQWSVFGRVAVFIDMANVMYTQRSMGWSVSFKKLRSFFKNVVQCNNLFVYLAIWHTNDFRKERDEKMISMLKESGYRVKAKTSKQINGVTKGNCDVELAIDAVRFMGLYDTIVLFSGDGDFTHLLEYLQEHGKKTIVVSYRRHVAKELLEYADVFLPLSRVRQSIEYKKVAKITKTPRGVSG